MFTVNLFACFRHLASRSRAMDVDLVRLLTYLLTPSNRSRVPNLRRPLGAKTVTYIWRSRGRDCNTVSPCDVTTEALCHDYQASLCLAINNTIDRENFVHTLQFIKCTQLSYPLYHPWRDHTCTISSVVNEVEFIPIIWVLFFFVFFWAK